MTYQQLAIKLNGGFRPLSFKLYDDGHMVIITHEGKKVSIAKEIVSKAKTGKDKETIVPDGTPAPAAPAGARISSQGAHERSQDPPARHASPAPPAAADDSEAPYVKGSTPEKKPASRSSRRSKK